MAVLDSVWSCRYNPGGCSCTLSEKETVTTERKRDRKEQYSIRINDQYRICFQVEDNNFFDVEIVDYH
ncbi:MAG: type II toxin-antitoxin system RelE/ParE family toxin [Clostridia bacterium]|nr:type II toxin-antitoxin system RelE/ParE family toxin [Clostridia bacterium]